MCECGCMYVCMYMYMCMYVCIHESVCVYAYKCMYVLYVCMCVSIYTYFETVHTSGKINKYRIILAITTAWRKFAPIWNLHHLKFAPIWKLFLIVGVGLGVLLSIGILDVRYISHETWANECICDERGLKHWVVFIWEINASTWVRHQSKTWPFTFPPTGPIIGRQLTANQPPVAWRGCH